MYKNDKMRATTVNSARATTTTVGRIGSNNNSNSNRSNCNTRHSFYNLFLIGKFTTKDKQQ